MKTLNNIAVTALLTGALWTLAPTDFQEWARWQAHLMVQSTQHAEDVAETWLLGP